MSEKRTEEPHLKPLKSGQVRFGFFVLFCFFFLVWFKNSWFGTLNFASVVLYRLGLHLVVLQLVPGDRKGAVWGKRVWPGHNHGVVRVLKKK